MALDSNVLIWTDGPGSAVIAGALALLNKAQGKRHRETQAHWQKIENTQSDQSKVLTAMGQRIARIEGFIKGLTGKEP